MHGPPILTLCTYAEAHEKTRRRFDLQFCQGRRRGCSCWCLCPDEACRADQPFGSGRIDATGRRLYLPSAADSEGWNVLGSNSLLLSAVMWATAPTLGSPRRAVMWASGV